MANGETFGTKAYSSLKYTGAVITDRFTATSSNQQLITLTSKDGKTVQTNSLTIEADASDLYISVLELNENVASYVWTDSPVFHIPAGETRVISGMSISHIKFSNNSGAKYFIQGLGY